MRPAALTACITLVLVAAIAVIVAGIAFGGGWRWAGGVATAALAAALVLPNLRNINHDKENQK